MRKELNGHTGLHKADVVEEWPAPGIGFYNALELVIAGAVRKIGHRAQQ